MIILVFLINFNLIARSERNVHGNYTIDDIQKGIDFRIKIDTDTYYHEDLIPVHFIIRNLGYHAFRFYINQQYMESFFLEIINESGEEIQNLIEIKNYKEININNLQKNKIEDLDGNPIKEVILHPDEEFKKTFYIKNLPIGKYKLIGYFIPYSYDQQYKHHFKLISKNDLEMNISEKKSIFEYNEKLNEFKDSTPSPEEIVYLFLMAEYYKNWENYFKYLELNEFIYSYELFEKEYKESDLRNKQLLLSEFQKFLKNQNIEPIMNFKITKVLYKKPDVANVIAEVTRGNKSYRVTYLYNYSLSKKDIWKITGVVTSILKKGYK